MLQKAYLLLGLGLLHILPTHFNPGSEDGPSELQHVDAEQMAQFLGSCVIRHGRLVVVLLLHEGNVPELEHGRDHLKHGCRDREGNIHQGRLCAHRRMNPSVLHLHMFSSGVKPIIAMESMVWVKFSESL